MRIAHAGHDAQVGVEAALIGARVGDRLVRAPVGVQTHLQVVHLVQVAGHAEYALGASAVEANHGLAQHDLYPGQRELGKLGSLGAHELAESGAEQAGRDYGVLGEHDLVQRRTAQALLGARHVDLGQALAARARRLGKALGKIARRRTLR